MTENEVYTVEEVAERLKVSAATVRRLVASGQIRGVRVGQRKWRIPAASLNAYLEGGGKPAEKE